VSLASHDDARRVGNRLGVPTAVVPNAVDLPVEDRRRPRKPSSRRRLLLVGNLTYEPNVEAAQLLVREVLPRVRRLVSDALAVEIVGRHEPGGPIAALAAERGVKLRGYVDDLAAVYARADVAVIPLTRGAGTRIKLLEAFAAGVPVVTTPAGAAGLDLRDGTHLLLAGDADGLAVAVARLLAHGRLARDLARNGRALVEQRYESEVVGAQLRALMQTLDDPPG
jgi:glycosyltransferase involved in cell wall biosynthesis